MKRATAPARPASAPDVSPQIVDLVRRWVDLARRLEPYREAISEGTKIYNQELDARKSVGAAVGKDGAVLPVDGVSYVYRRTSRGGDTPDYERLWSQAKILAPPALRETFTTMEKGPAWQKKAQTLHSILPLPGAPKLVGLPGGKKG